MLNHVSGSFKGIVGVYQKHDFAKEKAAAAELWSQHIESLLDREADESCRSGMGIDLAKLERDARSRHVREWLKAANRIAETDPDYAEQLRAEAMALNGDPAFAELRAKSGRCANAEILIERDIERALRRWPVDEAARKAREGVAEVTATIFARDRRASCCASAGTGLQGRRQARRKQKSQRSRSLA